MSSSLKQISNELKQNILEDYLTGIDMQEVAKKYGFKHIRTCYYHIEPLSQENKLIRMKNRAELLTNQFKHDNQSNNQ